MRRLLKWLLVLAILGGIGGAVAYPAMEWWRKHSIPNYLTEKISVGQVERVVNSTGTVKPVRTVAIGAFVSGPIAEVYVDFNSVVKKDEKLADIDPRLLNATVKREKAALNVAKAELQRAEALLEQARNNEKRAMDLRAINPDYLSDTELDQFISTRKSQEAQKALASASVAQAQAQLDSAMENLGYATIVSPEAGIIIDRKVDKGQTVASSFQTPELFTLAVDMDRRMHIFASVDEADIGLIRQAQEYHRSVTFSVDAYPDELFEGRIYQIRKNGETTQNVVTYPVVIEAPNPDLKLMPNMTANISFQIEVKEKVLRVPAAALRFVPLPNQVRPEDRHYLELRLVSPGDNGQRTASEKAQQSRDRQRRILWVKDGDLLRAVPVTLGLIENRYAELVDGNLDEGQEVVTGVETPSFTR
jgi:HlyD family secretion protein